MDQTAFQIQTAQHHLCSKLFCIRSNFHLSTMHPSMHSMVSSLHATANPLSSRAQPAEQSPSLSSTSQYLGEEAGREAVAVMHATHINIQSTESWMSQPLSSTFVESSIRIDESLHDWMQIG